MEESFWIDFSTSLDIEDEFWFDNKAKTIEVKKKQAPKKAVNLVIKLAVPLAVIKPPPALEEPPIPKPPPSLFCNKTAHIMQIAKITCIIKNSI